MGNYICSVCYHESVTCAICERARIVARLRERAERYQATHDDYRGRRPHLTREELALMETAGDKAEVLRDEADELERGGGEG